MSDVFGEDEQHEPFAAGDEPAPTWPTPPSPPPPPQGPSGPWTSAGQHGWPGPSHAPRARTPLGVRVVVSAVVLAAAIMVGAGLGHLVWTTTSSNHVFQGFSFPGFQSPTFPGISTTPTTPAGPSNAAAIERRVDPALVDINATFRYQQASGEGTGIVLTSNGEVLTNNHVIEGATSISVTDVGNGRTYSATVVGYDASHDVAVLQLQKASGLATITLGDSSKATVGEAVLAIGNAGGVGGTPTSSGGAISQLGQSVQASDSLDGTSENLTGMIAVTADVQPGDSGGPLVDGNGHVLGIDTAGPSGFFDFSTQGSGAGYAIPINQAMSIVTDVETGTASSTLHVGPTAFLGVLINAGANAPGAGAQVSSALSGGAAAQAGLVKGDVITSIGGTSVSSASSVAKALVPLHPGDRVTITWITPSGQHESGSAVLQSGPSA